jgi:hypothetical protein
VTRHLLWGAGPGEIRTGLIEDDRLTEFRIIRLRRDTALLQAGEVYTARLKSRLGSGQALVDIGSGTLAVLQPCPPINEGALIEVEMVRGPIPEPGHWKLPKVRALTDVRPSQSEPGWIFSDEPWALALCRAAPRVASIVCPDAQSANEVAATLGRDGPEVIVDPERIEEADFDGLMEAAVAGDFPLPDGSLKIERTRAMTMIDVDGTAASLTLNLQAAAEIPRLLRLLNIGGAIGIDFVSMNDRDSRLQVASAFDVAAQCLGSHERTAINGYGFMQVIRPRSAASIPETLCGTRVASLSTESRAIALLRAAGRSQGFGARRLIAAPSIIDLIRVWPEETGALAFHLGVAIELVPDPSATGYGHVHVVHV